MKHREASIEKIYSSVNEMLAEARQIVKPTNKMQSVLASSNSHLEIHLPSLYSNDRFKQIIQKSAPEYKKIDRQRRKSSIKLELADKSEDPIRKQSPRSSQPNSLLLLTRLTDRYQLKSIINNFESELVDQKFHQNIQKRRRPLYNKKTVSLLPGVSELPSLKKQSQSLQLEKETIPEDNEKNTVSKIYLTITEQDIMKARQRKKVKQYKTIEETYPRMLKQLIEQSSSKLKKVNRIKDELSASTSQKKVHKSAPKKSQSKDKDHVQNQEEKYEPWDLQPEQADLNLLI